MLGVRLTRARCSRINWMIICVNIYNDKIKNQFCHGKIEASSAYAHTSYGARVYTSTSWCFDASESALDVHSSTLDNLMESLGQQNNRNRGMVLGWIERGGEISSERKVADGAHLDLQLPEWFDVINYKLISFFFSEQPNLHKTKRDKWDAKKKSYIKNKQGSYHHLMWYSMMKFTGVFVAQWTK